MDHQNTGCGYTDQQKEISVSNIIEEILRRIWLVLILAVICCVFFTGYKYLKDRNAALSAIDAADEEIELSDDETADVEYVLFLREQAESQTTYMANSVYMQIDPYMEECVTAQFMLQAEDAVLAAAALDSLQSYIEDGALAADLASSGQTDLETAYIEELISFTKYSSIDASEETDRTSVEVFFEVSVIHSDEEECTALADDVVSALLSYQEVSARTIGSYSISLISQTASQCVDTTLANDQYTLRNYYSTVVSALETAENDLSSTQLLALEQMEDAQAEEESEVTDEVEGSEGSGAVSVSISKKYLVLGFLVGVILAAILIVLQVLLRGTLDTDSEFRRTFRVNVFGQVNLFEKNNILVSIWRRIMHTGSKLSVEEEKQLAHASLLAYCRENGISRILLAGSLTDPDRTGWLNGLTAQLAAEGIEADLAAGVPYSQDGMEKLVAYEDIVLVERLKKSRYEDVAACFRKCAEQNRRIIGALILN